MLETMFSKKLLNISFFCVIYCLSCHSSIPTLDDYQVISYIPLQDVSDCCIFLTDSQLTILYTYGEPGIFNAISVYDIQQPNSPYFVYDSMLPSNMTNYYYIEYKEPYILSIMDNHTIKAFNINSKYLYELHFDYYFYSVVFTDYYMFMLADSGLVVWNLAEMVNPVEVFSDFDTSLINNGRIVIDDTLCLQYNSNGTYKLWKIHNPALPQLFTAGNFVSVNNPTKIVLENANCFISYYVYIWKYAFDELGGIKDLGKHDCGGFVSDFVITDTNVLCLLTYWDDAIEVGNKFDLSLPWQVIPAPGNYGNFRAFAVRDDVIFVFLQYEGIFIYKKMEDE